MNDPSDSTSNLPKTIAFFQQANAILRVALITAVLWPIFAIFTALRLTPYNAQTVTPLVTLSPLVPMFLFLLGAPFKYALTIAKDPDAKVGFRWVAAFIGVELAIGVYFAVIPVSDDPGLTPLLILAASAIFFLRVAQTARWLRWVLALFLVGVTFIFILGGRKRFEGQFENTLSPPQTAGQSNAIASSASANNTREVIREAICPGATPIDYSQFTGTLFTVDLRPDCFSGFIDLPNAWWRGWHTTFVSSPADSWISFWFKGYRRPDGPFPAGNRTQFPHHPMVLRVEGRGQVRFSHSTSSTSQATPPSPRPDAGVAAAVVQSSTPSGPITSGPVAATKDADVFHFGFWPCRRAAAATFCEGFLENESSQEAYEGVLPSDVKDNLGNDYGFEKFTINSFSCFGRRGGCWPSVGSKDSQRIKFQVDGVVPQARSLVLYIHLTTHGSPFAVPSMFNNTQAQDFTISIPIANAP